MAETEIQRKKNNLADMVFELDLSSYNKTSSDIDDIIFIVKADISDEDVDAILDKKQSTSDITFTSPNLIKVSWDLADYSGFTIDFPYKAGLFIKWDGESEFDENVNQTFVLTIIKDFTSQ